MKTKIIGVSGRARAGKDFFSNSLRDLLQEECPNLKVGRYSLANEIRRDLDEFLVPKFGFSLFENPNTDKEIYRPLLIGYGTMMRNKTDNKHWWQTLEKQIVNDGPDVAIISDIRFAQNDNDEVSWVQRNNGKLVHIKRFSVNNGRKKYLPFASDDEKKNEPLLLKAADYLINWETEEDDEKLQSLCQQEAMNFYHENINTFLK